MRKIFSSFITALTFVTVIPVPSRLIPEWNERSLKYFCPMLPVIGVVLSVFWLTFLKLMPKFSPELSGFVMTVLTLALTGGLHLDGLMDTCDAVFSHRDRETKLEILSDTHAGSFAVIGCVVIILAKTLTFAELFRLGADALAVSAIPIFSRLGMAVLLNNLTFAKNDGLARTLGGARSSSNNFIFAIITIALLFLSEPAILGTFVFCLSAHVIICLRIFGGITGDLLGAFAETSEAIMLLGMVIELCT